MLLATNGYTKLFDYISNTNKTYKVIAMLGYSSPTLDVDSEITKHDDINAHQLQTQIQEFLTNLVGESTQTPPIYSAIKVKGKRLYKYARQNQDVEIPDRTIFVESSELLEVNENKVTFYSTKTIKDTIDGMWVAGLPEKVNLIVSGQEYISIGDTVN